MEEVAMSFHGIRGAVVESRHQGKLTLVSDDQDQSIQV